jgi:hypothetical protein
MHAAAHSYMSITIYRVQFQAAAPTILLTDILYFAENVFTKSGCLPPPSWTVDDDVATEMVTSGHQMATSHQSHFD